LILAFNCLILTTKYFIIIFTLLNYVIGFLIIFLKRLNLRKEVKAAYTPFTPV
jgi:hypothetical protein